MEEDDEVVAAGNKEGAVDPNIELGCMEVVEGVVVEPKMEGAAGWLNMEGVEPKGLEGPEDWAGG